MRRRKFAAELHRQTMAFLADCRAAIRAMMPAGRGYVLALCIDDFAAGIQELPQTPIANQARAAALKSMAKEYGRMGLGFTMFVCQPPREMVERSAWRTPPGTIEGLRVALSPGRGRWLCPVHPFPCSTAIRRPTAASCASATGVMEMTA